MAMLNGYCPKCEKPIEAFVAAEDLRRVGDEGFAAYVSVSDVTCSCGGVLGEGGNADD